MHTEEEWRPMMIDVFLVGYLARQNNREEWKDGNIESVIS